MNLWVRSQDKNILMKVNRVCFQRNIEDEPTIYGYENYENYERLGIYKTKERALEVLDEIQSLLLPKLILNSYDNITQEFSENITIMPISTDIKQFNSYVYEMPKE